MEGKIAGIPLILIVLVLMIALLVDVPMVLLHAHNQVRLNDLQNQEISTRRDLNSLADIVLNPSPTSTPSATPTLKFVPRRVAPTGQ